MGPDSWGSPIAPELAEFLAWRKMAGLQSRVPERWLHQFDRYCADHHVTLTALAPTVFSQFIDERALESIATQQTRLRLLRQFAEYLRNRGIPVLGPTVPRHSFTYPHHQPYVYTERELQKLFTVIDTWDSPSHSHSNRTVVDPLLFRMVYGCGLRIMEALRLRRSDVDLASGVLHIQQGKNQKDRLVPMADSLVERCRTYAHAMLSDTEDTPFFLGLHGGGYDSSTIYRRFRQYLWTAGISHSGHGPRVHDLRHAYCVHRLAHWVREDQDLTNLLPYLAVYLGHSDFRGTAYYLRLTAELYPDLMDTLERVHGTIIPLVLREESQ